MDQLNIRFALPPLSSSYRGSRRLEPPAAGRRALASAALCFFLSATSVALAAGAEPRTPISAVPYEIKVPGSYYVTRNLNAPLRVASDGITIAADDVTLDLNGFVLRGGPNSRSGIVAVARRRQAERRQNVRIYNGSVLEWGVTGVDLAIADDTQISDLRVRANGAGVQLGHGSRLGSISVTGNRGAAIQAGDCTTVLGASVDGNIGDGISVGKGSVVSSSSSCHNARGIVAGEGSTIATSTASDNGEDGVVANQSNIKDTTANHNRRHGIVVQGGSTVTACTANANVGSGIRSRDFGIITGSTVYENDGQGIDIGIGNTVTDNQASFNGIGIHVSSSRNRIESNHITDSTQVGISFDESAGSSVFVKNTFRNADDVDSHYSNLQWMGGFSHQFFGPAGESCPCGPDPGDLPVLKDHVASWVNVLLKLDSELPCVPCD